MVITKQRGVCAIHRPELLVPRFVTLAFAMDHASECSSSRLISFHSCICFLPYPVGRFIQTYSTYFKVQSQQTSRLCTSLGADLICLPDREVSYAMRLLQRGNSVKTLATFASTFELAMVRISGIVKLCMFIVELQTISKIFKVEHV